MRSTPEQMSLRARLLQRLRAFAAEQSRADRRPGQRALGPQLFSYCAFATERINQLRMAHPVIDVVLSGNKEVWRGEVSRRLRPGQVFVLPGDAALDVVNIPDERLGLYEALVMEVRAVPPALKTGGDRSALPGFDVAVPLTGELVDALGHAASALADSGHAQAVADHRLTEVLLLLRDAPAAGCLFAASLALRVRWLMLEMPAHERQAVEIARRLGMGPSTLRRRLAASGQSLRQIGNEVRMQVARDLLAQGGSNVGQAAQAAGYVSRSHFARQFRRVHGELPSRSRAGFA